MSEFSDRLVNFMGAFAIGVADRVRSAAQDDMKSGGETTAALVVIGHSPGLSIDQLGRVLRLSHPGAVRLVDRLTASALVMRNVAPHDRRTVALSLTEEGRARRAALLERRRAVLEAILQAVSPEDQAVLERVFGTVLRGLPSNAVTAMTVCRFCDQHQCVECPMNTFGVLGQGS